ncbi:MAG: HAD family hydrolase [Alkalispirochaeta sp.]
MKQHLQSRSFQAILFDIDNTLYRNDAYAQWQIDALIEQFAAYRQIEVSVAHDLIAATREEIAARNGRRPSLGNTMEELGISIALGVEWRSTLVDPYRFLSRDPELSDLMRTVSTRYRIAALTNNPVDVGRASLDALGIADLVPLVIGLDTTWHSKPDWEPFQAALDAVACTPEETLMVGDRYDVDIAPVLDHGGSGIIVERRDDLFVLPQVLAEAEYRTHP